MADSPNTRNMSKFHSRRTALAGIAGTLALATGAVGAVALQSASPDAELIALCDRYIAEWAAYNEALEREWDEEARVEDREPPCPPELQEPLLFGDGPENPSNCRRENEPGFWLRDTLARYAEPDSTTAVNRIKKSDNKLFMRSFDLPVPEETRARCRYLVTVHDRWEREIEAVQGDLPALKALSEEADQRCWDTLAEILEHEPLTLAGIAAMSRAMLQADMLATSSDEHQALEETILKAIVRLNGGLVS